MMVFNWREELRVSQRRLQLLASQELKSKLNQPVYSLPLDPLLSVPSSCTIRQAAREFMQNDLHYALVQDTPDTIQGVLRSEAVHAALVSVGTEADRLVITNIMDRNICVEPDSATIEEVLNRIAWGGCSCAVLVDSMGRPSSLASPPALLGWLSELLSDNDERRMVMHG